MTFKPAPLIGLVIILAALAFGARAFVANLTPYVAFREARERSGQVQVMGALDKASVVYRDGVLSFTLVAKTDGDRLPVQFKKTKPGNFEQAVEVTAIGRWDGAVFQADNLLVKCPSKYQGTETKSYGADPR